MDETIRVGPTDDQHLFNSKSPDKATLGGQEMVPEVDVAKEQNRFKADDEVDSKHRGSIRRSVTLNDNVKRRRNVSISMGSPNENGQMQLMTPKDLMNIQDIANQIQMEESAMSSPSVKKERISKKTKKSS